jgi:hypothetical protein
MDKTLIFPFTSAFKGLCFNMRIRIYTSLEKESLEIRKNADKIYAIGRKKALICPLKDNIYLWLSLPSEVPPYFEAP